MSSRAEAGTGTATSTGRLGVDGTQPERSADIDRLTGDRCWPGPRRPSTLSVPWVRRLVLIVGPVLAVLGGVFSAVHGSGTGFGVFVSTTLALLFAVGMVALALSLPDLTAAGIVFSVTSLAAAAMAWTHTTQPAYTWAVVAIQGVLFAAWTFPWFRDLPVLPRLGSAWLGIPVWLFGAASALLLIKVTVAGQRIVYGAIAVLTVLLFIRAARRTGKDITIGVVAGLLIGLAVIVVSGSANLFSLTHYAPPGPWGAKFNGRFWGGEFAVIHPNGMAVAALLIALRVAPDPRFARWQRLASVAVPVILVFASNSRTGVLAAGVASAVWALVLLWRHRASFIGRRAAGAPAATMVLAAAVLPLVLTAGVTIAAGGQGFLLSQRYGRTQTTISDQSTANDQIGTGTDVRAITSGRTENWTAMLDAFRSDTAVEKALGDTSNSRGYLLKYSASVKNQPKLTPDDAPIAELRRAGVLGVLTFLLGFGILFWGLFRRRRPLWWGLLVVAALATIATSDQTLGGTGSTLWGLLAAGEVAVLLQSGRLRAVGHRRPPGPVTERGTASPGIGAS